MWYAIQKEPGKEEMTGQQFGNFGSVLTQLDGEWRELFCVKKKRYQGQWHDERDRFLPEYVFFITRALSRGNRIPYLENADSSECCGISGQTDGFCPVKREEEELLIKLTGGKDEVDMSYGVIRDDILSIYKGPLTGLESRVKKIDRHKRKGIISMNLLGKEYLAEVGLEITEMTYSYQNMLIGFGLAAGCGM